MDTVLAPALQLAGLGLPDLLTTLIVVVVALLVVRFLLKVAVRIAIVAAIVLGAIWLFGFLPILEF